MKKTRKSYSPSFKTKVVLEMLKEVKSISEISSEYGVHATQLHRWRKEFLERAPEVFSGEAAWVNEKAQYDEKIEDLYSEVGKLTVQLSWLKGAPCCPVLSASLCWTGIEANCP